MAFGLAEAAPGEPRGRTHRIVDGDTLRALAERYLGSAERAEEIYQANRHLLPSPEVLPIGVELHIPAQPTRVLPSPHTSAEPPLVPVPTRVLRRR